MGMIGKVLSYVYAKLGESEDAVADIKFNPGGGANQTTWHAEPANQTSQPLAGDFVVVMPIPGEGKTVAVAFIDPKNPQDIAAGEHKTYSRDETGAIKCSVHLKADGTITINNDAGSFEMQAGGNVIINGVTIDTSGNITGAADVTASGTVGADTVAATSSLTGAGIEHVGHVHGGVTVGAANTAPII